MMKKYSISLCSGNFVDGTMKSEEADKMIKQFKRHKNVNVTDTDGILIISHKRIEDICIEDVKEKSQDVKLGFN